MQVGIVYAVYEMQCQYCRALWVASVEAKFIEWPNGNIDINHSPDAVCPNCGLMTSIEDGEPDRLKD